MAAFLYTWNPKRWTWADLAEAIYRVNNNEKYSTYWSCGNTRKIEFGDIFLLVRLGEEPKGIVGCGYIASSPYPLPHWNPEKAKQGLMALRTNLQFKALSAQPIISLDTLNERFPSFRWTPEAGGITIPNEIALELFSDISSSSRWGFDPESADELKLYVEGAGRTITSKTYDRSAPARQACIEHYGYDCKICKFNFKTMYGSIGDGYVEVHHLRQLADMGGEYLIDPIKDLRPVCANCHRMLHMRRPPYSIEELINEIGEAEIRKA